MVHGLRDSLSRVSLSGAFNVSDVSFRPRSCPPPQRAVEGALITTWLTLRRSIMQKCMAIMIAREVDSNQAAQMRTNRQAFLDEAVKSCATMCDSVSAYKRDGGILLENGTPVPYRVLVSTAYM